MINFTKAIKQEDIFWIAISSFQLESIKIHSSLVK